MTLLLFAMLWFGAACALAGLYAIYALVRGAADIAHEHEEANRWNNP